MLRLHHFEVSHECNAWYQRRAYSIEPYNVALWPSVVWKFPSGKVNARRKILANTKLVSLSFEQDERISCWTCDRVAGSLPICNSLNDRPKWKTQEPHF